MHAVRSRRAHHAIALTALGVWLIGGVALLAFQSPSHRVSVRVSDASGRGTAGVRVALVVRGRVARPVPQSTSRVGAITPFVVRHGDVVEVVPIKPGYLFSPPSRTMVVDADVELEFLARGQNGVLRGLVTEEVRTPDGWTNEVSLGAVRIRLQRTDDPERQATVSRANGDIAPFPVEWGRQYFLTPEKPGYTFDPPSRTVEVDDSDLWIEFVGTAIREEVEHVLERAPDEPRAAGPMAGPRSRDATRMPPAPAPTLHTLPLHRLQACLSTDGRQDAGTDDDVWISVNGGTPHLIDSHIDDFERNHTARCHDLPFETMTSPEMARIAELRQVTLGLRRTSDADDWCAASLRLVINDRIDVPIFDRPENGCHWFGADVGGAQVFKREFPVRVDRATVDEATPKLEAMYRRGEAHRLATREIRSRLEGRAGHNVARSTMLTWRDRRLSIAGRVVGDRVRYVVNLPVTYLPVDTDHPDSSVEITYEVVKTDEGTYLSQVEATGSHDGLTRRVARDPMGRIKIGGRPYRTATLDGRVLSLTY